jgi:hypothetical protein
MSSPGIRETPMRTITSRAEDDYDILPQAAVSHEGVRRHILLAQTTIARKPGHGPGPRTTDRHNAHLDASASHTYVTRPIMLACPGVR